MADAAMTVLLETLSHLHLSNSDLISGAEDELRLLANEIELFRAFFRDVANTAKKEETFREMERQIEEAIYDVHDTIDSYSTEPAGAQSKIPRFHRPRQVIVTELLRNRTADVRSFRDRELKPLLEEAGVGFPDIEEPHQIVREPYDFPAEVLLKDISELFTVLGGDLISGAEDELRLLKNEVELLRVLPYYAAKEDRELFMKMEKRIKRYFFRIQESFEPYFSQAADVHNNIDLFLRRRDLYAKPASSLAEVVRTLREEKVKPILEKGRVDFAEMLPLGDGSQLEDEAHQIKVNKVWSINKDISVGLEDEQATITDALKQNRDQLDFIAIIGMAGMGKTILARRIYQTHQIQHEFPTRIWVTISRDFNKKDVFLTILKGVTSKDMSREGDDELASAVHHFLTKRKFLLVLDDVWALKDLLAIQDALPASNGGSKVLITSRIREVGDPVVARRPCRMRFLREDECWELLQLEVFGGLCICPPELVEVGQQVAGVCGGMPLTLVIVGGILADEVSKTRSVSAVKKAWVEVFEYMSMSEYGKMEITIRVVELGYDRLPYELRNLFLYLGVFPEDFAISATTLIRLWIAEGFIRHQEGRSLEDIAEEHLKDLIQRKLVNVDKVRSNGKVKSCHLHDIVREFCVYKGMQVNLFREIANSSAPKTLNAQKHHRRLSVHSDLLEILSLKPYVPHVRSFSYFDKTESTLHPGNTSEIPGDAFELLRVLDIKPIRFTRFPLELTQLYCLRYIVLSCHFKVLSESISKLRNIQTLVIHTSSRTLEIRADIWKMIQLRHLQTNASIILRNEPENHSDQELQTLTNLSPENCTDNVLHRVRCLKKLGVRGMLPILLDGEVGFRKFDHFEKLKELENLKLVNDVHMSSPSECRLSCLPPTENFPPKLRSLTLSATFLTWEHMSVLGMLEKLEVLKLKDNAFLGECWEVVDGSFPSLQVLQIGYTNLVSWKVTRGHFPKLRSLALRNCEKLDALPRGLEYVLSLQEIELLRPTKELTVSAREIVEKRQKMEENHSRMKLTIYFPADE